MPPLLRGTESYVNPSRYTTNPYSWNSSGATIMPDRTLPNTLPAQRHPHSTHHNPSALSASNLRALASQDSMDWQLEAIGNIRGDGTVGLLQRPGEVESLSGMSGMSRGASIDGSASARHGDTGLKSEWSMVSYFVILLNSYRPWTNLPIS
jgi:hypothetical protein